MKHALISDKSTLKNNLVLHKEKAHFEYNEYCLLRKYKISNVSGRGVHLAFDFVDTGAHLLLVSRDMCSPLKIRMKLINTVLLNT